MGTIAVLWAALAVGCANPTDLMSGRPIDHEPRGPGAVFGSIDAAAVDALAYAYLQAHTAREVERARGGTIYRVGNGYSYDEIRVAGRVVPGRVRYKLEPQDVGRFVIYPRGNDRRINWRNEKPSPVDWRGVLEDPFHRPVYILHPSLMIREYRGEGVERTEVADLRHPERGLFQLARGREFFVEHCAICHGERADGRGVLASSLSREPTSFCDPSWASSATPEHTYRSVSEGVSGTPMPAWKATLSERETWDLVAYVTDEQLSLLSRKPAGLREATRDLAGLGEVRGQAGTTTGWWHGAVANRENAAYGAVLLPQRSSDVIE